MSKWWYGESFVTQRIEPPDDGVYPDAFPTPGPSWVVYETMAERWSKAHAVKSQAKVAVEGGERNVNATFFCGLTTKGALRSADALGTYDENGLPWPQPCWACLYELKKWQTTTYEGDGDAHVIILDVSLSIDGESFKAGECIEFQGFPGS